MGISETITPSLVLMLISHSLVVDSLSNGTHTKCTNMTSPMFSKLMNSPPRPPIIFSTVLCLTPTEKNESTPNNSPVESPQPPSEPFKTTQVPQMVSKRDDVPNPNKFPSQTKLFKL